MSNRLCEGGELFYHITKKKHLTEAQASSIMKQAFYALCYLHSNRICHRDIKPENFLLYKEDDDSHIKLIDFGLAKRVNPDEVMNKPNGTPYTGMTNDLMRRILEHKNKINEGFSKRYGLDKLVYYEIFKKPLEAITREKRIKKWKRQWKIELIEFMNPDWKDLAEDWY